MEKLRNMPNIGAELEKKLQEVGIETADQLRTIGSEEAFLKIRAIDGDACLNMLCALEGAIQGIRWHGLAQGDKQRLKEFYQFLK